MPNQTRVQDDKDSANDFNTDGELKAKRKILMKINFKILFRLPMDHKSPGRGYYSTAYKPSIARDDARDG